MTSFKVAMQRRIHDVTARARVGEGEQISVYFYHAADGALKAGSLTTAVSGVGLSAEKCTEIGTQIDAEPPAQIGSKVAGASGDRSGANNLSDVRRGVGGNGAHVDGCPGQQSPDGRASGTDKSSRVVEAVAVALFTLPDASADSGLVKEVNEAKTISLAPKMGRTGRGKSDLESRELLKPPVRLGSNRQRLSPGLYKRQNRVQSKVVRTNRDNVLSKSEEAAFQKGKTFSTTLKRVIGKIHNETITLLHRNFIKHKCAF
ncbi:unnamed protein product [Protopolystoma xenopodis]|uniref:Uncharacterized protein n=1 Tax=Protopolystoma xenopodis TaxID=117903 RepID=A0A3S5BVX2_9PLAT|nr:unnamed protein product [Protopolystoma xenopodis]